MGRIRRRIGDGRVLALVKAFLKAGILDGNGQTWESDVGTPQGGILSPLLANVALSVLDEHFDQYTMSTVERAKRRRHGLANYRIIRYADDFVVMVSGNRAQAESLLPEIAAAMEPMGLRLSVAKTAVTHIDEGLDFLGWRIQRHRKRGTAKHYVYTYPSKKALGAIKAKVKAMCMQNVNETLADLLRRLNPALRGWTAYFRAGVSSATFEYLRSYAWMRVTRWLRKKHRRTNWEKLLRRYCPNPRDRWWPADGNVVLFDPASVSTTRYRYRGAKIPSPWPSVT
jgi:RNA-directed DNA polymerase